MSDKPPKGNRRVTVSPINRLRGEIRIPGDKSISHRVAMLAAIASGRSTLKNFSTAADCQATVDCLRALGAQMSKTGSTLVVEGVGAAGLKEPADVLDAVNSGTTIRLLAGILAGQPFQSTITGDESLRARPMLRVADPLRLMGAVIETGPKGNAPLRIHGRRPLRAIHYSLPVASAQIKSAVLLAGLAADGRTTVEEHVPTRDHSERLLKEFGASIERTPNLISIAGDSRLIARDLMVPGDLSSAAFYIAAAVMLPGSDLTIHHVGLNPTRTAFLKVLSEMGADVNIVDQGLEGGEPFGTLRVRGRARNQACALTVSGDRIPNVIDELPLLAFLAAATNCELEVRDAAELRVKESDRIAATVENLRRMGAKVEERADGWRVHSGQKLSGANLESFGDHRIAMACAVAGLSAQGDSIIEGAKDAVAVSLPEFWAILESVAE